MKIIIPLLLPLLLTFAEPGLAIREGTATADLFITHYTKSGDFGKLALWHDAAAECLTRISIPMNDIAHAYYTRHGHKKWAARAEKEKREIRRRYEYHRKHATIARKKSETPEPTLKTEQQNIEKFILTWLPRYPNRFYQSGIYPTFLAHLRNHA